MGLEYPDFATLIKLHEVAECLPPSSVFAYKTSLLPGNDIPC